MRSERAGDRARVFEIHEAAFGRRGEAMLVDLLRAQAQPQLSLVAERAGSVVGHVFFSPMRFDCEGPAAAGLGPLGVWPAEQGRGAGSALVRAGLAACPALGWQAVFLLGNPAYYGRFGFVLAVSRGLHYKSEAFDAAFQLIELEAGVLAGCSGLVHYHVAFEQIERE